MRRSWFAVLLLFAALLLPATLTSADEVQISRLHCNDAEGAPTRKGETVTIAGVVTGQFSTARTARLVIQDATGGMTVYGGPPNCAALGDSVRVTGVVTGYRGLTEITGTPALPITITAAGRAKLAAVPRAMTTKQILAGADGNGCEPGESQLVVVTDVFLRARDGGPLAASDTLKDDANYLLVPAGADSAATLTLRVAEPEGCDHSHGLEGLRVPAGVPLRVVGIVSQYLPQGATSGGWQLMPRVREDLQPLAAKK